MPEFSYASIVLNSNSGPVQTKYVGASSFPCLLGKLPRTFNHLVHHNS